MAEAERVFTHPQGFPADSPFLEGHFPGNPVVPGAMMLGYLADCLSGVGLAIDRVRRMKFRRPLPPGRAIEVKLVERDGEASVEFRDADGVVASGTLVLRPFRHEGRA